MGKQNGKAHDGMVEVYRGRYSDVIVVKSLLESAGIPCVIKSHATFSVHTFAVNGLAEAWILVCERDANRALEMLLAETKPMN